MYICVSSIRLNLCNYLELACRLISPNRTNIVINVTHCVMNSYAHYMAIKGIYNNQSQTVSTEILVIRQR